MPSLISTPFSTLTPDTILNATESLGFVCSGSLFPLNSYENRVYQIGIENSTPLIAKFYRPHRWSRDAILEEHQFSQELEALEIPVVAPWKSETNQTLHEYEDFRFALFPRKSGSALEVGNIELLEWMGRFIGRLHAVGACRPFQYRRELNAETYGYRAYQFLIENRFIPDYLKDRYCHAAETALQNVEACFQKAGPMNQIRLHGDMHCGNILWSENGPHIVDLDDCLMGPAIQDIWMLLSGDETQVNIQLDYILNGYNEFFDFNYRELHLIEALRTLRIMHYSAWLANRWEDPAFPRNFPWFNTAQYWQEHLEHINQQIDLLNQIF